jgi:thiamine-phosphate pyrophosphorylase
MQKPSLSDYRLYFVTDSRLNKGYSVLEQVELALQGGVKIIQVREKELSTPDYIALASEALKLTRAYNAFLIIDDCVEAAAVVGADGIHLGQDDMPIAKAAEILGKDAIIGISVKTEAEAIRAEKGGADYIAVNGVFPTQTKVNLGELPGLESVTRIRNCTHLPVIGIGGINLQNCRGVIDAGADGVAVVTAITMSDDIPRTCRSFLETLGQPGPG